MSASSFDAKSHGFEGFPEPIVSPAGGIEMYRCWGFRDPWFGGDGAGEWGSGYYSPVKPTSVLDAETRFNILNYDDSGTSSRNGIHFVSTFRLLPGFSCWRGRVAGGVGEQFFVEGPLQIKLQLVGKPTVLRHDFFVSPKDGSA